MIPVATYASPSTFIYLLTIRLLLLYVQLVHGIEINQFYSVLVLQVNIIYVWVS